MNLINFRQFVGTMCWDFVRVDVWKIWIWNNTKKSSVSALLKHRAPSLKQKHQVPNDFDNSLWWRNFMTIIWSRFREILWTSFFSKLDNSLLCYKCFIPSVPSILVIEKKFLLVLSRFQPTSFCSFPHSTTSQENNILVIFQRLMSSLLKSLMWKKLLPKCFVLISFRCESWKLCGQCRTAACLDKVLTVSVYLLVWCSLVRNKIWIKIFYKS